MDIPYKRAFRIPSDLFLDCLVKKETVIGIIGKVQGMKNAKNPPINPIPKSAIPLLSLFSCNCFVL